MAWAAAQELLVDGKTELTAADIDKLKKDHHYLFATAAAPAAGAAGAGAAGAGAAGAAGAGARGSNPAAVTAAGTLSTQPAPSASGAGAAAGPKKNARDMTKDEFDAWLKARGQLPSFGS